MKTIKTSTIFLFVLFTIAACNKEEIEPKDVTSKNSRITLDNNRIKFDSYQDYESHIHNYELSEEPQKFIADFKSRYTLTKARSGSSFPDSLNDEFLESILNDNSIVQIGDYLYKVNLFTDKVYVLNTDYESEIIDLVSENISNTNIKEYSTSDHVIDLVEGLEGAVSRCCGGVGGGEYPFPQTVLGEVNGAEVTMTGGVRFLTAGIYFSLTGKVFYFPQTNSMRDYVKTALHMKSPGCWYKKKPCRNNDIRTKNGGYILPWGNDNSRVHNLYSGMRNLNGYYLFVRGRGTLIDNNGNWFNTQNASSYGGINISSPW